MIAKKKSLGLAAFGAKSQLPASAEQKDVNASVRNDVLTPKGKGDIIACTVRLPRSAWLKIQHLALDEGSSFQAIAVAGLDAELKRRGLPGMD